MRIKMTLFQQGLILVLTPLLLNAIFLAMLYRARTKAEVAGDLSNRAKENLVDANEIYRSLLEAQILVRNAILSSDVTQVGSIELMLARANSIADEVDTRVADSRTDEHFGQMRAAIDAYAGILQQQLGRLHAGQFDQARALTSQPESLATINRLRDVVNEFVMEERRVAADRIEAKASADAWQRIILTSGGLATLAVALVMALIWTRGINGRLRQLVVNTQRLAAGTKLAPRLEGGDEVAEVDSAFHDMADSLSEQRRENEMFVYSVSHDLRSPLVNLEGFSHELEISSQEILTLLERPSLPEDVRVEAKKIVDRDMKEAVGFIKNSVKRLAAIIDALLRLSRVGRVELQWQMVDVQAAVGRVVDSIREAAKTNQCDIKMLSPLPPAWGDVNSIERIFDNLINNSVKYACKDRPGLIEIGCLPEDDSLASRFTSQHVYFVRDDGLGIPPEYHHRVFTAFTRLHPNVASGEGVGLAMVRRIVERHNGQIWLESEPGTGTTIFLALPRMGETSDGRGVPSLVPSESVGGGI